MNLAACQQLPLAPATGHWYRAIQPKHWATLLQTKQTEEYPTRFNPAQAASQPFQTLYLAQTRDLTLWEVDATVGVWHRPGGSLSVPGITWIILAVTVNLQHIADLTDPANQQLLEITAQELTGDWRGYEWRGSHTQVPHPVGIAPTQELGVALHAVPALEGFYTISAKVPLYKALVIFPDKLVGTSFVDFSDPETSPYTLTKRRTFALSCFRPFAHKAGDSPGATGRRTHSAGEQQSEAPSGAPGCPGGFMLCRCAPSAGSR